MSPLGAGQAVDDGLQRLVDADAGLGRGEDGVGGVETDHVLDLGFDAVDVGGGEVDLVEDGDDLVVVVQRLVDVGEGLRLYALGGVHHEEGAFASGEAARHLIRKVHVGRACRSG